MPSPIHHVPRSRFFERWAKAVLFARWPVLLVCALFTYWMGSQAIERLVVDTRFDAFLPRASPAAESLAALRNDFGNDSAFQVVIEGDVLSPEFLERLGNLQVDLARLELTRDAPLSLAGDRGTPRAVRDDQWGSRALPFERIDSVLSAGRLVALGDGVAYRRWLDPMPPAAALPALRSQMMQDPSVAGRLLGTGGRHTVIVLHPAKLSEAELRRLYRLVDDTVALYDVRGFRPLLGGPASIDAAAAAGVLADLEFLLGAEAVAMLLVMWFVFRHPIGVLGPLLAVGQAAVVMFGWMALSGLPVTLISSVLGAFVLCVGTGFALHIQFAYRNARFEGLGGEQAIVHAVAATGVPLLFTVLTTCVGLLSFLLADMQPVRQLGLAGAAGIFFSALFALTFLPAWLSLHRRGPLGAVRRTRGAGRADRLLSLCDRCTRRAPRRKQVVLGVALLVAVVAGVGTFRVHPHHDPLGWLPADAAVVRATRALDQHVGGSSELSLMLTTKPGHSLLDPALEAALQRVVDGAVGFHDPGSPRMAIGSPESWLDRLRAARRVLDVPAAEGAAVTRTRAESVDLLTLWQLLAPERLREQVTLDLTRALVTLRVHWRDAEAYSAWAGHVQELVTQQLARMVDVQWTGSAFGMFSVVRSLMSDLVRSFSVALLVITGVMMVLLRDVRLGLLAMVSNLWPIVGMLGFMGFSGRSVDVQNVLLASLALGISVDNTIHFLHQFRVHFAGYGDVDAAVAHAFAQAGRAMLGTSAALLVGFAVLGLGYMGSTRAFGLLASVAVLLSLLGDLIVLPALLRAVYRSRPRVYDPEAASSYDLTFSEFV